MPFKNAFQRFQPFAVRLEILQRGEIGDQRLCREKIGWDLRDFGAEAFVNLRGVGILQQDGGHADAASFEGKGVAHVSLTIR